MAETTELPDHQVIEEAIKQSRWWHNAMLLVALIALIPSALVVILTLIPATRASMLARTSGSDTNALLGALVIGTLGALFLGVYHFSRRDMARVIENARANPDSPDMRYLRKWWSRPGSAAFFEAMKMMLPPVFAVIMGAVVMIVGAYAFVLYLWPDNPMIGLLVLIAVVYLLSLVIPRLRRKR
jgi:hypothetical protein